MIELTLITDSHGVNLCSTKREYKNLKINVINIGSGSPSVIYYEKSCYKREGMKADIINNIVNNLPENSIFALSLSDTESRCVFQDSFYHTEDYKQIILENYRKFFNSLFENNKHKNLKCLVLEIFPVSTTTTQLQCCTPEARVKCRTYIDYMMKKIILKEYPQISYLTNFKHPLFETKEGFCVDNDYMKEDDNIHYNLSKQLKNNVTIQDQLFEMIYKKVERIHNELQKNSGN